MSAERRLRLWITVDRQRFFLLPADATLPPGDLEVRSLHATTAMLDEQALAPHEVDIQRAAAHVDAGWEGAIGRVLDSWRELVGGSSEEGPPPDLGRWLGVTPGEALTDPAKQRQGRRTLIERAGRLIGADLSEERVERIDQRLEKLADALVRDAGRLRTGTERLAERIEERRPEIEATLEETERALSDLGRGALERLRSLGRKADPEDGT